MRRIDQRISLMKNFEIDPHGPKFSRQSVVAPGKPRATQMELERFGSKKAALQTPHMIARHNEPHTSHNDGHTQRTTGIRASSQLHGIRLSQEPINYSNQDRTSTSRESTQLMAVTRLEQCTNVKTSPIDSGSLNLNSHSTPRPQSRNWHEESRSTRQPFTNFARLLPPLHNDWKWNGPDWSIINLIALALAILEVSRDSYSCS